MARVAIKCRVTRLLASNQQTQLAPQRGGRAGTRQRLHCSARRRFKRGPSPAGHSKTERGNGHAARAASQKILAGGEAGERLRINASPNQGPPRTRCSAAVQETEVCALLTRTPGDGARSGWAQSGCQHVGRKRLCLRGNNFRAGRGRQQSRSCFRSGFVHPACLPCAFPIYGHNDSCEVCLRKGRETMSG